MCGQTDGCSHAVAVATPGSFRLLFVTGVQWANALLAISVEQLLGYDCDDAAEAIHRASIKARCTGQRARAVCSCKLKGTQCVGSRRRWGDTCNAGDLEYAYLMQAREDKAGGASNLLFYAPLEAVLQHDGKYVSKVQHASVLPLPTLIVWLFLHTIAMLRPSCNC